MRGGSLKRFKPDVGEQKGEGVKDVFRDILSDTWKEGVAGFKKKAPLRKRPYNTISGFQQGLESGIKRGVTNEVKRQATKRLKGFFD